MLTLCFLSPFIVLFSMVFIFIYFFFNFCILLIDSIFTKYSGECLCLTLQIVFNQEPGEGTSLSRHKESLAQYYKVSDFFSGFGFYLWVELGYYKVLEEYYKVLCLKPSDNFFNYFIMDGVME